jgi:hypothetical protein
MTARAKRIFGGAFAFYLWAKSEHKLSYQELIDTILSNVNYKNQNIDLKQSSSIVFK